MSADPRVPFEEALGTFLSFLASEGWSTDLWWMSRERLTGYRRELWLLRSDELVSSDRTRQHYESGRRTDFNLRFEAMGQLNGHTLAFVDVGPGRRSMLNFAICTSQHRVRLVGSTPVWWVLRELNAVRGEAPMLRFSRMP
jgi:hypothetical protein